MKTRRTPGIYRFFTYPGGMFNAEERARSVEQSRDDQKARGQWWASTMIACEISGVFSPRESKKRFPPR